MNSWKKFHCFQENCTKCLSVIFTFIRGQLRKSLCCSALFFAIHCRSRQATAGFVCLSEVTYLAP